MICRDRFLKKILEYQRLTGYVTEAMQVSWSKKLSSFLLRIFDLELEFKKPMLLGIIISLVPIEIIYIVASWSIQTPCTAIMHVIILTCGFSAIALFLIKLSEKTFKRLYFALVTPGLSILLITNLQDFGGQNLLHFSPWIIVGAVLGTFLFGRGSGVVWAGMYLIGIGLPFVLSHPNELTADPRTGVLNGKQKEYLDDLLKSSRHLLSLINDMLDLSKIEAGRVELSSEPVDPNAIIQTSADVIKEKLDAQNITLDGGTISIDASHINGHVAVSVRDTGLGLSSEELGTIFEPFEQGGSAVEDIFVGTGLGLSLSRSLIELHGGSLTAESAGKSKGSTFTITPPHTP